MRKTVLLYLILSQTLLMTAQIQTGIWRAELTTPGGPLPFNFWISLKQGGYHFDIRNGEESISTREVSIDDNVLFVYLPVFNSTIVADISADRRTLTGVFNDYSRGDNYSLKFNAVAGENFRFIKNPEPPLYDIGGKWKTQFIAGDEVYDAIGVFTQNGNTVQGTFLTETGDYRYLQGDISGDQFLLSAFDGSHAFLFTGTVENDSSITGKFFSGKHWEEKFTAIKNDTVTLPDPTKLTYLNEGYTTFDFCFPIPKGDTICSSDPQFQNKVTIIQIMGTWCPNCMDESAYLAELYQKYHSAGVEIVALGFERETDPEAAYANFERLRRRFAIEYPILLAGSNKKAEASAALPMLNKVIAFPTLIILDRNKQVAWMHTGFNGPATGQLYTDFLSDFEKKLEQLLK